MLGNKPYLVGDRPTDVDCTLFGFICVILNTDSMYKTLVEKRLTNLYNHMKRMKAKYFPDWDELLQEVPIEDVPKELLKVEKEDSNDEVTEQSKEQPKEQPEVKPEENLDDKVEAHKQPTKEKSSPEEKKSNSQEQNPKQPVPSTTSTQVNKSNSTQPKTATTTANPAVENTATKQSQEATATTKPKAPVEHKEGKGKPAAVVSSIGKALSGKFNLDSDKNKGSKRK